MRDLIDRQAAITAICDDGLWLGSQGCTDITLRERNQRDVGILSELPTIEAEPEQKWIPCTERLPEKYGWYQVTLKDGRVSRLYYDYKGDRWVDNVRKHMFELYDIYSKITHKRITEEKEDVYWDDWVVAWMPLPKPYERREDGRK